MNDIKFTGRLFRPYNHNSVEVIKPSDENYQFSTAEASARRKKTKDDQICLTRFLTDRSLEIIPTGVTAEIVEKFIENEVTDQEQSQIKKMLELATSKNLDHLSEQNLKVICFLELQGKMEAIHRILSFDDANEVLSKIGRLWKKLQVNQLQTSSLSVHEIIPSVVEAVIDENGKIDLKMVEVMQKSIKIEDVRHHAHVERILNLLANDVKFRDLIENVKTPGDTEGTGTVKQYIRIMLRIGEDKEITKIEAQRAVLGAVLSDIRQGNTGSCYGTAIAICVHDTIPHLMVEDLSSMVEKGYFIRTRNTNEGKVEERFYIGEHFLENAKSELNSWALSMGKLSKIYHRLKIAYPEFEGFFLQAENTMMQKAQNSIIKTAIYNKENKLEYTDEQYTDIYFDLSGLFDNLLMDYFQLTSSDLKNREKLKDLSEKIQALSVEASLNNDKKQDQELQDLIDEYQLFKEKSKNFADKLSRLASYDNALLKLVEIFYVEKNQENLLTTGWEYAIMSAELREIQREYESNSLRKLPMMKELFKEVLFNKDRGEVFMKAMAQVLKTLQGLQSQFNNEQKNQLSKALKDLETNMKSIVDQRITVHTYPISSGESSKNTAHALIYAMGEKEVRKFKVLNNEKEYSEAILSCMMEAFEALRRDDKIDVAVKDFLMTLKGILGDQFQSQEFQHSVTSFIVNANFIRTDTEINTNESDIYRKINPTHRVFSVYFEKDFQKSRIIEMPNMLFIWLLEKIGYIKRFPTELDLNLLTYWVKISQLMMVFAIAIIIVALFNSYLLGLGTFPAWIFLMKYFPVPTSSPEVMLKHFIEANRAIYKEVSHHDEWIKYPLDLPMHVCNLMPFNRTIRKIVESNEDIATYIKNKIQSPNKTTIAVMDLNYKGDSCYAGFELGSGDIKFVELNSKFETKSPMSKELASEDISISSDGYKAIDEMLSKYQVQ